MLTTPFMSLPTSLSYVYTISSLSLWLFLSGGMLLLVAGCFKWVAGSTYRFIYNVATATVRSFPTLIGVTWWAGNPATVGSFSQVCAEKAGQLGPTSLLELYSKACHFS